MKKRILLIVTIIIACNLLTACQPTPDEAIVVGKGEEQINKMLESSNKSENTYTAPEKLNYKLESDKDGAKVNVDINASVIVPEYAPTLVSVKPKIINFGQIDSLLDLVLQDEKLYHTLYAEKIMTKKKIQSQIDSYLWQISMCDSDESKDIKSSYQKIVKNLYKNMEKAPDTYADVVLDLEEVNKVYNEDGTVDKYSEHMPKLTKDMVGPITITPDNFNKRVYQMEIGESSYSDRIRFSAIEDSKKQNIYYSSYNKLGDTPSRRIEYSDLSVMKDFALSLEEAKKMAEPYINCLDNSLILIDAGANKKSDYFAGTEYFDGYTLVYGRQFNGVNTNYVFPDNNFLQKDSLPRSEYNIPYPQEYLIIQVCEGGVYYVNYRSPMEVIETVNKSPELLPFSKIQDIFDEYILINGLSPDYEAFIKINRIELGMMRIDKPNSPNEHLVVPVWDFYGSAGCTYIEEGVKKEALYDIDNPRLGRSFLTINAIDGSIINRSLRY